MYFDALYLNHDGLIMNKFLLFNRLFLKPSKIDCDNKSILKAVTLSLSNKRTNNNALFTLYFFHDYIGAAFTHIRQL